MHDHLADKQQIILIARLTIDVQGQLLHGEIVDLEGTVIGRFTNWTKLNHFVQTWLANTIDDSG
jgi:hypothetical protein